MTPTRPISRRTLAVGAAWAVPTALMVGVTPAYAASLPCVTVDVIWEGCKGPGMSNPSEPFSYDFSIEFTNSCGTGDATVQVMSVVKNNGPLYLDQALTDMFEIPWPGVILTGTGTGTVSSFSIPAGGTRTWNPPILYSSNSAATIVITYKVGTQTYTVTSHVPPRCAPAPA